MLAASSWLAKPVRMAAASAACGQAPGGTARGAIWPRPACVRRRREVALARRMIAPLRSTVSPWPTAISAPPKPVEVIGSLLPDQLKWKVFFSRQAKNPKYLRHGDVIEAAAATIRPEVIAIALSPACVTARPTQMVSTVLVNSVDNVSKKVSTVGLAAETTRRMIVIRWQNLSFVGKSFLFGIAFGAVALLGLSVLLADPGPLARSVVAGRQRTGTLHS